MLLRMQSHQMQVKEIRVNGKWEMGNGKWEMGMNDNWKDIDIDNIAKEWK